jgi:chromosome segregation ATPase
VGAWIAWILIPLSMFIGFKVDEREVGSGSKSVHSIISKISFTAPLIILATSFLLFVVGGAFITTAEELKWIMVFVGLVYLLYIPHSCALYLVSLFLYYKFKLPIIEYKIRVLREKISEYDVVLEQRSKVEQDIRSIIALDPSNLSIKAREFRERTQKMTCDEIKARRIEISLELSRVESLKEEAKKRLKVLEDERRALESRVSDINTKFQVLKRADPANFQIKMRELKRLEGIGREELERMKPTGMLEELFFERALLNHKIKDIDEEIRFKAGEIHRLEMEKLSLQLENLTLDLEEVDRTIRSEEPRLFEVKGELSNLEAKRREIEQFLSKK